MSTTTGRQIIWSVAFSLLLALITSSIVFVVFPLTSWADLWTRHFMDIPIVVFIPAFSIAFGSVVGTATGLYWRKQFHYIERSLHQIEEGRHYEDNDGFSSVSELQAIASRIGKIDKQLIEQVKLSQRLATEKAEEQEERIQEIVEQERQRLARELHDSVSQQLFAASMMMSAINATREQEETTVEARQLKLVEEMIHQSQLEMRALLLHLRPVALKNKTLQEGIEELLMELSQKVEMEIKWNVESFPLDKGIEDHLFRILQESISNTLRHAKAASLDVKLIKRDHLVIMRVVDDGVGFEMEEEKAGSYGMQNMNERALEIGGALKIVSVKNQGTRLEVKVPLVEN
ncbi:sensor histidine kinase [Bacillus rubiinfantis]|uniref:sensor histidine kinase n=1 Tax=Bacillus rubiinfantis TaxID=1499680 RepID=UPI0005AAD853|nr:sensor histidine kinase [Bacillus rubiinfantis]